MRTIYKEFKERQQKETNNLPIYFAFGNEQLQERANELGFESIDDMINNVVGIGAGGFCKKEDYQNIINTFKKHNEELKENLKNDEFLKSAFRYEMSNHEYIVTYDIYDTLRALEITLEEYQKSERMKKLFEEAKEDYLKAMNEWMRVLIWKNIKIVLQY